MIEFVIDIPPITKKNHQQIILNKSTKRHMVIPSKQYRDYEKASAKYIPACDIDFAVNVKGIFYMPTRRRVDLVNLQEALLDVLVKYGCIKDDNATIVVSMDGSRVEYDKERPRTLVTIEEVSQ